MSMMQKVQFEGKLLHLMSMRRQDKVISRLDKDLAQAYDDFGTLLHYAASHCADTVAQELIRLGAKIDALGRDGKTPLMLAVKRASDKVVKILLEAGANMDMTDTNGQSSLQMVFSRDCYPYMLFISAFAILQLFFDHVRNVSQNDEDCIKRLVKAGLTAHHIAYTKDAEMLKSLLKYVGANNDINSKNHYGKTAMNTAAEMQHFEIVNILVDNGAEIQGNDDETLHYLAHGRNFASMKVLLEKGANASTECKIYNYTPLRKLYEVGRVINVEEFDKCVAILLQHGGIAEDAAPGHIEKLLTLASIQQESKGIDYLIAHLAMLEMSGKSSVASIARCNKVKDRSKNEMKYKLCQELLKVQVFESLALLDLLTCTEYKMRLNVRNAMIISKIEKFCTENGLENSNFYYYDILMKRFAKATRTVKLEDEAILIICNLFEKNYNEGYIAAKEIVGYLGERDLEQLCKI